MWLVSRATHCRPLGTQLAQQRRLMAHASQIPVLIKVTILDFGNWGNVAAHVAMEFEAVDCAVDDADVLASMGIGVPARRKRGRPKKDVPASASEPGSHASALVAHTGSGEGAGPVAIVPTLGFGAVARAHNPATRAGMPIVAAASLANLCPRSIRGHAPPHPLQDAILEVCAIVWRTAFVPDGVAHKIAEQLLLPSDAAVAMMSRSVLAEQFGYNRKFADFGSSEIGSRSSVGELVCAPAV